MNDRPSGRAAIGIGSGLVLVALVLLLAPRTAVEWLGQVNRHPHRWRCLP